MKERTNKRTGQRFYGCAKFGKGGCGETLNLGDPDDPYYGMTYEDTRH